jgi:hypothetical protein
MSDVENQPTAQSTPFFRLPSELRNHIYELVLSCSYQLGLSINNPWGSPKKLVLVRIQRGCLNDDHARKVKQLQPVCRARSGRKKLVLSPIHDDHCYIDNVFELNQLKYVCRQLYLETRDLEMKLHGRLTIRPQWNNRPTVSGQLSMFCKGRDPARMSWLSTIVLCGCRSGSVEESSILQHENAQGIANIARIARAHPTVWFKLLEPHIGPQTINKLLNVRSGRWGLSRCFSSDLRIASILHSELRGVDLAIMEGPRPVNPVENKASLWRGDFDVHDLGAPNLTVFPQIDADTDWEVVGQKLHESGVSLSNGETLEHCWLRNMMIWCERGILAPMTYTEKPVGRLAKP